MEAILAHRDLLGLRWPDGEMAVGFLPSENPRQMTNNTSTY